MENEIDISDIFRVLWRGRYLIIGIILLAVFIAGVMSLAIISPTYKASCIVALGNYDGTIYTNQETAVAIMLSDEYLMDVIDQLNFEVPPGEFTSFKAGIHVAPVKGSTDLLMISSERKTGLEGVEIVEAMVELFAAKSEEIYNIHTDTLLDDLASVQRQLEKSEMDVNQTRQDLEKLMSAPVLSQTENEIRISRTLELLDTQESKLSKLQARELELQSKLNFIRNVEVIQEAREPVAPIASKRVLMLAVAGMIGMMVAVFVVFLREGLRRAVG